MKTTLLLIAMLTMVACDRDVSKNTEDLTESSKVDFQCIDNMSFAVSTNGTIVQIKDSLGKYKTCERLNRWWSDSDGVMRKHKFSETIKRERLFLEYDTTLTSNQRKNIKFKRGAVCLDGITPENYPCEDRRDITAYIDSNGVLFFKYDGNLVNGSIKPSKTLRNNEFSGYHPNTVINFRNCTGMYDSLSNTWYLPHYSQKLRCVTRKGDMEYVRSAGM